MIPAASEERTMNDARAWANRSAELARWAWHHYVVRDDVWGGYTPLNVRGQKRQRRDGAEYVVGPTCTHPSVAKRGRIKLTLAVTEQHFRATRPEQVIGVHTTSPDNFSKFGTVEVDYHGETSNDPENNLHASLGWYRTLAARGFRPLLWDSNGKGGYHLDLLLAQPISTPRLFWFLRELVSNHAGYAILTRPETFPKQTQLRPRADGSGRYGNCVRLPGRHHTREVWPSIWDGSAWTAGERAINFLLSLQGDDPGLVPEYDDCAHRIRAYLAKVPHGGEGTGRDDRAYQAALFLVRDMGLSDAEALPWLEDWDAGNLPPKGRERLQEIIANAHHYGQNAYRSGLNGASLSHTAPLFSSPPAPLSPQPEELQDGLQLILRDFQERYQPRFRRGTAVYSDRRQREVKPSEACFAADKALLDKLGTARDAPRDKRGEVDVAALPRFFWTWSKSAWAELLNRLPEEEDAEEISGSAEEQFRQQLAACLFAQAVFDVSIDKKTDTKTEQQRRTLLQWCQLWAKPGSWRQVRSALLWCRRDNHQRLCVALRAELFGQYGPRELAGLSPTKFAQLAEQYDLGVANVRACGTRVVELTANFLASLEAGPDGS